MIDDTRVREGPLDLTNPRSNISPTPTPTMNTTNDAGHLHGKKNKTIHAALFNKEGRAQHGPADQFWLTSPTGMDCNLLKRTFQFVRHSHFVHHHDVIV